MLASLDMVADEARDVGGELRVSPPDDQPIGPCTTRRSRSTTFTVASADLDMGRANGASASAATRS